MKSQEFKPARYLSVDLSFAQFAVVVGMKRNSFAETTCNNTSQQRK